MLGGRKCVYMCIGGGGGGGGIVIGQEQGERLLVIPGFIIFALK